MRKRWFFKGTWIGVTNVLGCERMDLEFGLKEFELEFGGV